MFILASASPRRQELLRQIGCAFRCMPSRAAEDQREDAVPEELVLHNARVKAKEVSERCARQAPVLGADTIVFLGGKIYGKPASREDAVQMLASLAGREHFVYTGIALVKGEEVWQDVEKTTVKLAALTREEIEAYVATGEPMDKAGAYAIQGYAAAFVEEICGSYTNVVGLPLSRLLKLCRKAGIRLK